MESYLHQLSGSTFIFFKNTHQKTANLTLLLILAAGMVYIESFEVKFIDMTNVSEEKKKYVSLCDSGIPTSPTIL